MDGGLPVLPDLNGSPVAFIQEDGSVSGVLRGWTVSDGCCGSWYLLRFSRHGQNMLLLQQWGSMSGWDGSG